MKNSFWYISLVCFFILSLYIQDNIFLKITVISNSILILYQIGIKIWNIKYKKD